MKTATIAAVHEAQRTRRTVVLATRLRDAAETLIFADSRLGDLPVSPGLTAAAEKAVAADSSGVVELGGEKIFLHVYIPAPRLIVVGAVHIAQALVPMAAMTGYEVAVIDPRRAFGSDARFPGVLVSSDWPDEALTKLKPEWGTAVVTLTHDPKLDDPALAVALRSDCFYIGALGSRRTHEKRLARLTELGFGPKDFTRIHGPVGLSIGAKSPSEIAISIMAQITQVRRSGAKAQV